MQKWEHMIFAQVLPLEKGEPPYWDDDRADKRNAIERLNDLGEEGWELATAYRFTSDSVVYILKRPKE
jgi:hypothetical protein